MKLSDYDISKTHSMTLQSTEVITPEGSDAEVRHLVLRFDDEPFQYVEGQSIGVLVPGPHEFGNKHHLRLYSIASPSGGDDLRGNSLSICVRRCFSIDYISGERYPGRASNYLCDSTPGDTIEITGPYGVQFQVPESSDANLLMVGVGTGIAPFRAFVKSIYRRHGGWQGKVRLFYGARTGVEMLYLNQLRNDLALYYDQASFKAFEAVSPRPHYDEAPDLHHTLIDNARESWDMIQDPKTYVYLAGLTDAEKKFEMAMEILAGGKEEWQDTKASLIASGRYSELLYE